MRQFGEVKVLLIVCHAAHIGARYAQFQREILIGLLRHTLFRKTDRVKVRKEMFYLKVKIFSLNNIARRF